MAENAPVAIGKFKDERARRVLHSYGVRNPKLTQELMDLDNTDPERIVLDFLPGAYLPHCMDVCYHTALASKKTVMMSANGVRITVEPLEWMRRPLGS